MSNILQVSAKHKSLILPHRADLANLVTHRVIDHPEQGRLIVIPHTRETTKLVRNFDYNCPAPILTQYDWNGDTPFRIQKVTAALLTMQPRAFVLSEMGTGKTRAVLHATNYLMFTGEVRRALVIAPLSTLQVVWHAEVFDHFGHLTVGVLHGSKQNRLKVLGQGHDIYVINHDGVETIMPELAARTDIGIVVIDELGFYRNKRTNRWAAADAVCARRPFVWGLTGSPTPNEPSDAWAQIKLLQPNKVSKHFNQFRRSTMLQVSQFRWVPRPEAKQIVYDAMQPAVRYKRDDCIELPETTYYNFPVGMSSQQTKVYKDMIAKLRLMFAEGQVTAANEGVLFSKLLQIASGYVYTADKKVVVLDNKPRMQALTDKIAEAEGKLIVFVSFIHAAKAVHQQLVDDGITSRLITGEVSASQRALIFNEFQRDPSLRVLVAHPKTMSHGLTLTQANTIVWFTPNDSLDTYQQACARITRPGQTRKTYVVHLTGSPVEAKIYRRLSQNASLQGALLEMFEGNEI